MKETIKQFLKRHKGLEKRLNDWKYMYYQESQPVVSDAVFDAHWSQYLKSLEQLEQYIKESKHPLSSTLQLIYDARLGVGYSGEIDEFNYILTESLL